MHLSFHALARRRPRKSPESWAIENRLEKNCQLMLPYMPSPVSFSMNGNARHLHGLTMEDYFTGFARARAVQTPCSGEAVQRAGPDRRAIRHSNPTSRKMPSAWRAGLSLTEVRVCFDKDLKARTCTAAPANADLRPSTSDRPADYPSGTSDSLIEHSGI